jgi:methylenetetrahydrofolate dehydrogenase (NADP+) / methenyltetrahydrofolate cyclohydrolase
MAAKLLDGKLSSEALLGQVKSEVMRLGTQPCLAIVSIGENPSSQIYMKKKLEACQKTGMKGELIALPAKIPQEEAVRVLQDLNAREDVSGIIVQTPIPSNLDAASIQSVISPYKDADGFGIENLGWLFAGKPKIKPATPAGIMAMLSHYRIPVAGRHAVIVGRSNTVGKPIAQLLLMEDATVTIAHSKTRDLSQITKQADILIAAVGKPKLITSKMVKKGAVVVDVGMNRVLESGKIIEKADGDAGTSAKSKLVGDVDFEGVSKIASWISPVRGGVGPMTVASLISNTLICHRLQRQ